MTRHLEFDVQLENFRNESAIAAQYIYAEMAIQHAVSKSTKLLNRLNHTPRFWIVCGASLQTAAYISLGRIFDTKSPFNVNALLDSMESNLHVFQRQALATRKREGKTKDPSWLKDYLNRAYYPTHKDVARLRAMVAKYRLIYDRAIKPVRHKYLAHREKERNADVHALFAAGTVRELWRLTTFLIQLNEIIWQQLHNGRKPVFYPIRHSVKSIYDAKQTSTAPHESIVADVKKLMQLIARATPGVVGPTR